MDTEGQRKWLCVLLLLFYGISTRRVDCIKCDTNEILLTDCYVAL